MAQTIRLLTAIFSLIVTSHAISATIIIQPDAVNGKDMWANPSFGGAGDDENLHVWKSNTIVGFKSLIEFTTLNLAITGNAGLVQSARLNLFVLDNEAANNSHAPGFDGLGVEIDVSIQANPWTEITAAGFTPAATNAWNSIQALGQVVDSNNIDAVNQWISFDVTNIAKGWLDHSIANNGLILSSPTEIRASDGNVIAAAFASSNQINATLRPFLEIVTIPAPTTIWLLGLGLISILGSTKFRS